MDKTIVTPVITKLFARALQKLVTLIASAKLSKLQLLGSDSAPATSFVISEGFLKAMITVIYSGKRTVRQPNISTMVKNQFVCCFFRVSS